MKYRIMATLSFERKDEAKAFWDLVKSKKKSGLQLSNDGANYHRCFHDEEPAKPCEIIESFESTTKPKPIT